LTDFFCSRFLAYFKVVFSFFSQSPFCYFPPLKDPLSGPTRCSSPLQLLRASPPPSFLAHPPLFFRLENTPPLPHSRPRLGPFPTHEELLLTKRPFSSLHFSLMFAPLLFFLYEDPFFLTRIRKSFFSPVSLPFRFLFLPLLLPFLVLMDAE